MTRNQYTEAVWTKVFSFQSGVHRIISQGHLRRGIGKLHSQEYAVVLEFQLIIDASLLGPTRQLTQESAREDVSSLDWYPEYQAEQL